jgi:hypothetical protein
MNVVGIATAKLDQQDYLIGCFGDDAEYLSCFTREYSIVTLEDITSDVFNSQLLTVMKEEYDVIKYQTVEVGNVLIPYYKDIKFLVATNIKEIHQA